MLQNVRAKVGPGGCCSPRHQTHSEPSYDVASNICQAQREGEGVLDTDGREPAGGGGRWGVGPVPPIQSFHSGVCTHTPVHCQGL